MRLCLCITCPKITCTRPHLHADKLRRAQHESTRARGYIYTATYAHTSPHTPTHTHNTLTHTRARVRALTHTRTQHSGLLCSDQFGWGDQDPGSQPGSAPGNGQPWRNGLNPAAAPVTRREYKHEPRSAIDIALDPMLRGGARAADHVDIMGNHEMIADVLHLAAGEHHVVQARTFSQIDSIAARVKEAHRVDR